MLAQLRRLQFLDHARVTPSELHTALELHQVRWVAIDLEAHSELFVCSVLCGLSNVQSATSKVKAFAAMS